MPAIQDKLLEKINELSILNQQYVLIMLKLASVQERDTQTHKDYAEALCVLFRNIINYDKNDTLARLADALDSVLITYFLDQNNLMKRELNMEAYEVKHANLLAINQKVDYFVSLYYVDFIELEEFKNSLFQV